MRCVEIRGAGGPEVLHVAERPRPVPGPGEVLVRVAAAGVNWPDVLQRRGKYPPPPGASDLPGLEVAGTVEALGPGAARWRVGDAVCALLAGGGYAECTAVPAVQCLPIPTGLTPVAAAALPETVLTVWANVFEAGGLRPGQVLLVHGASGGIGTTALQMARAAGARVVATTRGESKRAACAALGADLVVDSEREDFVAAARAFTVGRGVDLVLDMVGAGYFARNLEALAVGGRLAQIAFLTGGTVSLDLMTVMRKRLTVTGSTLRPRSPEEKGVLARAVEAQVWPWIAAGRVTPRIHATFPLAQAADAHRLLESGQHVGKVVLLVAS